MNAPLKSPTAVLFPVVITPVVRVLVVEDDNDDRELLLRQFIKAGLSDKVVFVADGTVAWQTLIDDSVNVAPHLCAVLLDLKIPGVSGLELLKMLRQRPETKTLPVFIISGSSDPQEKAECVHLGVSGFVPKPISYPEFCKAIATIFHRKADSDFR